MEEEEKKDVDLYAELKATLEKSEEEETSVASDQKPKEEKKEVVPPKEDDKGETADLSEDEISKLSPRAQKRIREQAEQIRILSEKSADKTPDTPTEKKEEATPQDFKSVQEFLAAVEDEPSRKLLEKFYGVIRNETSSILAPIEAKNNEARFETEFSRYEKIEGLADYKNDLKKTFLRNPNQSFKALVGEVIADLSINKVKPVETQPSNPNRSGKVSTEGKSKDELYDILDTLKP